MALPALNLANVKAIALAVTDLERAIRFTAIPCRSVLQPLSRRGARQLPELARKGTTAHRCLAGKAVQGVSPVQVTSHCQGWVSRNC